tara:strand:+ start:2253 stop:2636 length:384 start_codon:yes stop_codon:yes gene_type:complete
MNFTSIIDFNKFTVAIAVGCLVYATEKILPPDSLIKQIASIVLIGLLVLSIVLGVFLFAAATAACNAELAGDRSRVESNQATIKFCGTWHSITLGLALLIFAALLYNKFSISTPEDGLKSCVCCKKE